MTYLRLPLCAENVLQSIELRAGRMSVAAIEDTDGLDTPIAKKLLANMVEAGLLEMSVGDYQITEAGRKLIAC